MQCPGERGGCSIRRDGLSVPPVLIGTERTVAIYDHFWDHLMAEERNDPQWSPDNDNTWTLFFLREHVDHLAPYDGNGDSPSNHNISGRRWWWSALGRTFA
jgi:hypothetical protein